MKLADREDEIALVNVERSPLLLLTVAIISAAIVYVTWRLLAVYNPWGFIIAIPAAAFSYQLLWLLLHPFAKFFGDRVEISQSFLHTNERYYTDIKKVTTKPGQKCYITFYDDEVEKLSLLGIKPSHFELLTTELQKQVELNQSSKN